MSELTIAQARVEDLQTCAHFVGEHCGGNVLARRNDQMDPWVRNQFLHLARRSGFNLLVKGKDVSHTRERASQSFELAFGDLELF